MKDEIEVTLDVEPTDQPIRLTTEDIESLDSASSARELYDEILVTAVR